MKLEEAIKRGIQYCIAHGLLSEFFGEHIEEVETVFAEVWDYDTALAVGKEEAHEAGLAEGREEGRAEGAFDTILTSVRNMVSKLKMTADAAMDVLNVVPADRPAILAAL